MGAYLSTPITDKQVEDGAGRGLKFGISAMQGWRKNMEDAHIAEPIGDDSFLFAVFDGHCGKAVSQFCAKYFKAQLETNPHFIDGDIPRALSSTFLLMDQLLTHPEYIHEVKVDREKTLAGLLMSKDALDSTNTNDANAPAEVAPAADPVTAQESEKFEDSVDATEKRLAALNPAQVAGKPEDAEKKIDGEKEDCSGIGRETEQKAVMQSALSIIRSLLEKRTGESDDQTPEEQVCNLKDHAVRAGSTAVVALVTPTHIFVANAGDSRAVLVKNNRAVPLSVDHKPNQNREFSRIKAAGGFVKSIYGHHRVNGNLNLSRAIGDLKYKQNPSLRPEEQIITADPDITVYSRCPDDQYIILACDGIWDCLENQQVANFILDFADRTPPPMADLAESDRYPWIRELLAVPSPRKSLSPRSKSNASLDNAEIGKLARTQSNPGAEVSSLPQSPPKMSSLISYLLDSILAKSPHSGKGVGSDNMTCIVVDVRQSHS